LAAGLIIFFSSNRLSSKIFTSLMGNGYRFKSIAAFLYVFSSSFSFYCKN